MTANGIVDGEDTFFCHAWLKSRRAGVRGRKTTSRECNGRPCDKFREAFCMGRLSQKSARHRRSLVASPFGYRSVQGCYPFWHGSQWRAPWHAAHMLRTPTRNRLFATLCHNGFTSAGPAVIAIARRAVGLCKRSMKGNRPVLASKQHAFGRPHADDPTRNSHVRAMTAGLDPTLPSRNSTGAGGGKQFGCHHGVFLTLRSINSSESERTPKGQRNTIRPPVSNLPRGWN